MQLQTTSAIVSPILEVFSKCNSEPIVLSTNLNGLLDEMRRCLEKSEKELVLTTPQLQTDKSRFYEPKLFSANTKYFPRDIQGFIAEQQLSQVSFDMVVNMRPITITFGLFKPAQFNAKGLRQLVTKVKEIYSLYYLLLNLRPSSTLGGCGRSLHIMVYLTPFAKTLPPQAKRPLGAENVNTAFTLACAPDGEILIYREEEWFKVLIHESFHAFGLDFGPLEADAHALHQVVGLESELNYSEAYSECWARFINCVLTAYFNRTSNFSETVVWCLNAEKTFGLYQCHKVLAHMGFTYNEVVTTGGGSKPRFQEETHAFTYYILTAVLFCNLDAFTKWCISHNEPGVFKVNRLAIDQFTGFIKEQLPSLLHGQETIRRLQKQTGNLPVLKQTTRMTIVS